MPILDVDRSDPAARAWTAGAIRAIEADANRSADTHLHVFPLPDHGVDLYLKDESVHPTGSLKHRLARSLFLHGLVNGWVRAGRTVVEASSGSTAVSEAYFAALVGVRFVAVMPRSTSAEKIALIERYGGRCHLVDSAGDMDRAARALAAECDGHYLDQFTYAERATDWRGNNTIAESVFGQLALERHPVPEWVVVGAGTGGTSATFGRYVRYRGLPTGIAVVDPEGSAFLEGYRTGSADVTTATGSRIEGIGRPRVELSFVPTVIDRMLGIPDVASVAAMRFARQVTGRHVGGSTGSNLVGALRLVAEMVEQGRTGSVVTLVCDGGERYSRTYDDDAWVAAQGWDLAGWTATLREVVQEGRWREPV